MSVSRPLLKLLDVSKRMQVSQHTIRYWVKRGTLPHIRLSPKVIRFDPQVIEEHIASRKREGRAND